MGVTSNAIQGKYKEEDVGIERVVSKSVRVSELNPVIQAYVPGGGFCSEKLHLQYYLEMI